MTMKPEAVSVSVSVVSVIDGAHIHTDAAGCESIHPSQWVPILMRRMYGNAQLNARVRLRWSISVESYDVLLPLMMGDTGGKSQFSTELFFRTRGGRALHKVPVPGPCRGVPHCVIFSVGVGMNFVRTFGMDYACDIKIILFCASRTRWSIFHIVWLEHKKKSRGPMAPGTGDYLIAPTASTVGGGSIAGGPFLYLTDPSSAHCPNPGAGIVVFPCLPRQ